MAKNYSRASYSLIVISLSACFLFYKYILQVYPGIMVNELMKAFDTDATGLGFLSASFFYTYVIVQIFAGILIDRLNVRYVTSIAITTSALGILIFSSANSLFVAQVARGFMGFGAAFITVSYLKVASTLFHPQRFGLLAGLMASSAMLGAMFGTTLLSSIVLKFGWRPTLFSCGWLGIILAGAFWLIVQENSTPLKADQRTPFWSGLQKILANKQNWLISLYCGLTFTPLNVFISLWGVPFMQEAYHLSSIEAAREMSFIFIGFAVGAPLLGWLSTYFISRYEIIILGIWLVLLTFSIIVYFPAVSSNWLRLLFFIFGFSTSSFMLGFAVARELNPPLLIATTIAFINSFEALCSGISEPLIGMFLDFYSSKEAINPPHIFTINNYQKAFYILFFFPIISLFVVKFIKNINED